MNLNHLLKKSKSTKIATITPSQIASTKVAREKLHSLFSVIEKAPKRMLTHTFSQSHKIASNNRTEKLNGIPLSPKEGRIFGGKPIKFNISSLQQESGPIHL